MIKVDLLSVEFNRFTELRRRLIETDPEIDETTLLDTLEGATDLKEALGCVVRSALEHEALAAALRMRLKGMKLRLERIEAAAAKRRQAALEVMEDAGLERILEPDFTASLRTVPGGLTIVDETAIPEWFWIPQPAKLDRRRLLEVIEAGTPITGVALANSRVTLSIRTK